jgi:phosphate starvation-inducible protein PhoH
LIHKWSEKCSEKHVDLKGLSVREKQKAVRTASLCQVHRSPSIVRILISTGIQSTGSVGKTYIQNDWDMSWKRQEGNKTITMRPVVT